MYNAYFQLTRNPFDLTPDPSTFVPSARHNEALAGLYYGVRHHKGFIVLTGEVGTGKTLLLRCLLKHLRESKNIAYAYLFNSRIPPSELLQYILADLGVPTAGKAKYELLLSLGEFLVSQYAKGITTVVIIDEAHHLLSETLEELRLLSNLETNSDKLVQIVLAGQPELESVLDSPELRQLKQRIAVRARLLPLDLGETQQYIQERLRLAGRGADDPHIFSEESIARIFDHSRGLPRLVNTICENSLIAAYAKGMQTVEPELIDEVAKDFRLDAQPAAPSETPRQRHDVDIIGALNGLLRFLAQRRESVARLPDM